MLSTGSSHFSSDCQRWVGIPRVGSGRRGPARGKRCTLRAGCSSSDTSPGKRTRVEPEAGCAGPGESSSEDIFCQAFDLQIEFFGGTSEGSQHEGHAKGVAHPPCPGGPREFDSLARRPRQEPVGTAHIKPPPAPANLNILVSGILTGHTGSVKCHMGAMWASRTSR